MTGDATRRFSARAEDYHRFRPRYPRGLITFLTREIGLSPECTVADLGAGTGISSVPFLELGNQVFAVEPNREMRRVSQRILGGWPAFRSVAGTAEETTLPDAGMDLVLAAQAFHWFDRDAVRAEFRRILRPGGRVALVWNSRRTGVSAFADAYQAFLERHGTDYARVRHDRVGPEALEAFFGGGYRSTILPHQQVLDSAGVRGKVRSTSYLPAPGEAGYEAMMTDLERLIGEYAGEDRLTFPYRTEVYVGELGSSRVSTR